MEREEHASTGDSGDTKKAAAIEECGLHRTSLWLARIVAGGRYDRHGWYCNAVQNDFFTVFEGDWLAPTKPGGVQFIFLSAQMRYDSDYET
jgi:hypothetical protein